MNNFLFHAFVRDDLYDVQFEEKTLLSDLSLEEVVFIHICMLEWSIKKWHKDISKYEDMEEKKFSCA